MNVDLLLMVGAVICFGLAAFGVAAGRVALMPLGLMLWALTHVI